MELRHLRYFLVLSEELHFGRAARRLFITQPPLSFNIRQLEESIGARLFERDSKHVALTPAGLALVPKAREIVRLTDKARASVRAVGEGRAGRLDVGYTGTMLHRGLGEVVTHFTRHYPEVELVMNEVSSVEQVRRIKSARLDAGFVNAQVAPEDVESMVVCEESFVACLPIAHKLAKRATLDVRLLADEDFVVFGREMSQAYYDYIVSLCADAGFHPRIMQSAGQLSSVVHLVAAGMGVSLLPESLRDLAPGKVSFVRLKGVAPRPSAYFIWHAERTEPGLPLLVKTVHDMMGKHPGLAKTRR